MRPRPSVNRAPDLVTETARRVDATDVAELTAAFCQRHAALAQRGLRVDAREGARAFAIVVVVGGERRAHELFVFARDDDRPGAVSVAGARAARDRAVDYLDGVLTELGRDSDERFLPLDWEGRPFDGDVVFVRGEVRDYFAEQAAAKLLGEDAPRRALDDDVSAGNASEPGNSHGHEDVN